MSTKRPLRVGSVPYLVGRPADCGLDAEPGIDFRRAVPARLVEELRQGRLDIALLSSIELFRRPGYTFLEGSAITGKGFVASVQLFLRRPVDELRRVALDPSSRTARALTRIVLTRRAREHGATPPEFVDVDAGDDPSRAPDSDAWLAIGDPALRRYLAPDSPPVFNPSEHWCDEHGLPFVFAAWVIRPGLELSWEQRAAFTRARERGQAQLDALAREASAAWKLPLEACRRYLAEECHYHPGAELARSLRAFRDGAAELGLCRSDLAPEPVAIPTAEQASCPG